MSRVGLVAALLAMTCAASPAYSGELPEVLLEKALPAVRAQRADLAIRSSRWDTRLKLPAVEALLEDPLKIPGALSSWGEELQLRTSSFDLVRFAGQLLGVTPSSSGIIPSPLAYASRSGFGQRRLEGEGPPMNNFPMTWAGPVRGGRGRVSGNIQQHTPHPNPPPQGGRGSSETARSVALPPSKNIPSEIRQPLNDILKAIHQAQPLLKRSVDSLSPAERAEAISVMNAMVKNEGGRPQAKAFDAMARFDLAALIQAASYLTEAVGRALPTLQEHAPALRTFGRRRYALAVGDVLLSGSGNDHFDSKDLDGIALLVDFGGNNSYEGPVAAAQEGQIRMVIDLGEDITVKAEEAPQSAGSGIFGIGLMYLPNPKGRKTLLTGDCSQGAGLFGVGGLFIEGPSSKLEGHRFVQGAAAFGLGLFVNRDGRSAAYQARFAGQGVGFTRGVGFFVHHGDEARLEGGLFYPDPRESLAMLSLCQGVGYGPRAFAAGGIGLALVQGNRCRLESSYFAQGSGYWHGLGGLFVLGHENRLRARRYDQGSGTHTAVGGLLLRGNKNQTVNWGVGPAYGWDYGVGVFLAEGDDNSFQTEWGTGHGEVNGHGLAFIHGDRNRLSLTSFGSGAFNRNAPSYGVALCLGAENRYRLPAAQGVIHGPLNLFATPWGVLQGDTGLALDPELTLPKPEWPSVKREEAEKKEKQTLQLRLTQAQEKPAQERITEWLAVAAAFSLDLETPRQAMKKLFSIPFEELPALIQTLSSDSIDEFLRLRVVLSGFGAQAAADLAKEFQSAQGTRKPLLLSFFSYSRTSDVVDLVMKALEDPDWRVRRGAAGVLGFLFSREEGHEPGRLPLLQAAKDLCHFKKGALNRKRFEKSFKKRLGQKSLPELLAVLSLDPELTGQNRLALLEQTPNALDPVGAETFLEFARVLAEQREVYQRVLDREISDAAALEARARKALQKMLEDKDREVVQIALIALGQLGHPEDAPPLARFLQEDTALVRHAAAAALGKMGRSAEKTLTALVRDPSASLRALAALSVAQTTHPEVLPLLAPLFRDPDEHVRIAALTSLTEVQPPFHPLRKKFLKEVARLEKEDTSLSVRVTARLAKASIQ